MNSIMWQSSLTPSSSIWQQNEDNHLGVWNKMLSTCSVTFFIPRIFHVFCFWRQKLESDSYRQVPLYPNMLMSLNQNWALFSKPHLNPCCVILHASFEIHPNQRICGIEMYFGRMNNVSIVRIKESDFQPTHCVYQCTDRIGSKNAIGIAGNQQYCLVWWPDGRSCQPAWIAIVTCLQILAQISLSGFFPRRKNCKLFLSEVRSIKKNKTTATENKQKIQNKTKENRSPWQIRMGAVCALWTQNIFGGSVQRIFLNKLIRIERGHCTNTKASRIIPVPQNSNVWWQVCDFFRNILIKFRLHFGKFKTENFVSTTKKTTCTMRKSTQFQGMSRK